VPGKQLGGDQTYVPSLQQVAIPVHTWADISFGFKKRNEIKNKKGVITRNILFI